MAHEISDLNFKATELRLGLPGTDDHESLNVAKNNNYNYNNKRSLPELVHDDDEESGSSKGNINLAADQHETLSSAPAPKAQIVGWPPVRSYRKNNIQAKNNKTDIAENGIYVKVSVAGAPYLRKIDLKAYNGYPELLKALETMFKFTIGEYSEREGYKGSEYAPAYEDKDGDLMLVGDVPWNMFMSSCKRLRIMKGSDARGLGSAV